jgi:hypothetical protein
MRYIPLAALISLVILSTTACTSYTSIQRNVPAKYHIAGIKKIVFTPFTHEATYHKEGSKIIPEYLEEALADNGFFEVIPSDNLELDMDETISKSKLVSIGRRARAGGVISGKVMAFQVTHSRKEIPVEKEVETGRYKYEKYEENGQTKYRKISVTEKKTFYETSIEKAAEVSFYADLTSTRKAKTLDHRYFTKIGTEKAQGGEDIKKMSSDDKMLRGVAKSLAKKFVLAMIPHKATFKIAFKRDKPCKNGVKLARKNDWQGASESWRAVLSADQNISCANYNLGIYYEVKSDFNTALSHYTSAQGSAPQEPLYSKAVKRIKNAIVGEKILERQLKNR